MSSAGARFRQLPPVARLAWGVLAYTTLVILWGAVVRSTGAGAGCGAHWPLCNGEVVPTAPALNTLIEFGHRVTSGLALPLVLWLAWRAWRTPGVRPAVRRAALAAVAFMVLEAAIGAGLVLFEYVAYDPRLARAAWMAAHLTNTFLLLGALTFTAWWAGGAPLPRPTWDGETLALGVATWVLVALGAGGAVTALGDTLVLGGGIDPQSNPFVGFLVSARVVHPMLAFAALAAVGIAISATRGAGPAVVQRGMWVAGLMVLQMALGTLNVWLLAPIWLQIVHLLMTDVIWVSFLVFASSALAVPRTAPAAVAA